MEAKSRDGQKGLIGRWMAEIRLRSKEMCGNGSGFVKVVSCILCALKTIGCILRFHAISLPK